MNYQRVIQEFDKILEARTGIPFIMRTFAEIESDITPEARRVEKGFYRRYMKGRPNWEKYVTLYGEDSYSSLGLFQIMFPTALLYDRDISPEDLKNPYINAFIAYRIIKRNIDRYGIDNPLEWIQEYNGGRARSAQTKRYYYKWIEKWDKIYKLWRSESVNIRGDQLRK